MLRSWPALLAWGAGLIHLAVGAAITRAGVAWPERALLAPMLIVGVAELGWGVAVLRTGRAAWGRAAAVGAIVAVVAGAGALVAGASVVAIGIASTLAVAGGSMAARTARAGEGWHADGERSGRTRRAGAAGMAVGAILVAALVTPGLAQTDAGEGGGLHDHGIGGAVPLVDPHGHH